MIFRGIAIPEPRRGSLETNVIRARFYFRPYSSSLANKRYVGVLITLRCTERSVNHYGSSKEITMATPSSHCILGLTSLNSVFNCEASINTWYYYVRFSLEEFLPSISFSWEEFNPVHWTTVSPGSWGFKILPCFGIQVNVGSDTTVDLPPKKVFPLRTANTKYTWNPPWLKGWVATVFA